MLFSTMRASCLALVALATLTAVAAAPFGIGFEFKIGGGGDSHHGDDDAGEHKVLSESASVEVDKEKGGHHGGIVGEFFSGLTGHGHGESEKSSSSKVSTTYSSESAGEHGGSYGGEHGGSYGGEHGGSISKQSSTTIVSESEVSSSGHGGKHAAILTGEDPIGRVGGGGYGESRKEESTVVTRESSSSSDGAFGGRGGSEAIYGDRDGVFGDGSSSRRTSIVSEDRELSSSRGFGGLSRSSERESSEVVAVERSDPAGGLGGRGVFESGKDISSSSTTTKLSSVTSKDSFGDRIDGGLSGSFGSGGHSGKTLSSSSYESERSGGHGYVDPAVSSGRSESSETVIIKKTSSESDVGGVGGVGGGYHESGSGYHESGSAHHESSYGGGYSEGHKSVEKEVEKKEEKKEGGHHSIFGSIVEKIGEKIEKAGDKIEDIGHVLSSD